MALSKHAKALKSSPLKHLPRYLQEMQQPPLHRTYLRQRLQHQLLVDRLCRLLQYIHGRSGLARRRFHQHQVLLRQ
ncbi:hypothetical protein Golax_008573 [Gossypium laxum]|uniref:Uncharacterized protein n=2 Tax=Gossypium TaxID=3633 RepID=A0A7J8MNC6_9ROSI|nr:hypothetical protein [Gossypium lobatum]MBA0720984.1 hypothetical protein [Gossypium laxum]